MATWTRRALAEGIGTYFLVLIGPGAIMVDAVTGGALGQTGIALAFGFVVLAMIYAIGHLSGAHINPAVTVGFWAVGRFPGTGVLPYLAAQTAGAVLAAGTLLWIVGGAAELGATTPATSVGRAFTVEFLLAFALMFVIMAVATDERVADGSAGLAVGLTVGFGALVGGPLTGASMNPARSFGPALVGGAWESHWLYWAAPLAGMTVAARCYEFLRVSRAHTVSRAGPLGVQGPLEPPGDRRARTGLARGRTPDGPGEPHDLGPHEERPGPRYSRPN